MGKMKQFAKFTFAAMIGSLLTLGLIVFFLLFLGIMAAMVPDVAVIPEKSVLHMKLNIPIVDRSSDDPMENIDLMELKPERHPGLNDILNGLEHAASDDKIKGIFLDLSHIPSGIAVIEEIRNALIRFKDSGKFILGYSEAYSQTAYYLASTGDEIYLHPEGRMRFKGLAGRAVYFKKALDKLEIKAQVIRRGKFKSAVEPFMQDKMSKADREQTETLIRSIWDHMVAGISDAREISTEELNAIADGLKIRTARDAVDLKLADELKYPDEVLAELRTRLMIGKSSDIEFLSMKKYLRSLKLAEKKSSDAKIAIVYASGAIVNGEGDNETIGADRMSKAIRKAREDMSVKAIVLRVNSPGGGILPSDIIWREMELAKNEKPTVVSMGNLAASGGYYISCAAHKIVASPNTITGSIGVYSIIPNMRDLMNNKLGITFDTVKTNENSDFLSSVRPMTALENEILEQDIEKYYNTFLRHVADGRKMTVEQVDEIGKGRVWSGTDAKRIGLVDELGGLEKAIEAAAEMADLDDYEIVPYPEPKNKIMQMIEALASARKKALIEEELGDAHKYYDIVKNLGNMDEVQARLPFVIDIY